MNFSKYRLKIRPNASCHFPFICLVILAQTFIFLFYHLKRVTSNILLIYHVLCFSDKDRYTRLFPTERTLVMLAHLWFWEENQFMIQEIF